MLAYLFWHRPRPGTDRAGYEAGLRAFHGSLEAVSASFRLDALPFDGRGGYEDWYLVEDWAALGVLNATAVDARHRPAHDRPAALAGAGWGGVYGLVRGAAQPPAGARWLDKPPGESYDDFLRSLTSDTVWQRQMVLGPAPEFCVAETTGPGRARV